MAQMTKTDVKIVNFVKRVCNYYLRKRGALRTDLNFVKQDKIQAHILPYIPFNSTINYVDVGAHKGDFVEELSKYFVLDKVILAEPIKALADLLQEKYREKGYRVFPYIVSDTVQENISFHINELPETSSMLEFESEIKELSNINTKLDVVQKTSSKTLDQITGEALFPEIDLLKIDVQGAEHLVIRGAKETLRKTKFLWIELSFKSLYKNSAVFNDIYLQIEKENFILMEISEGHRGPNGELLQIDALFKNSSYAIN